MNKKIVSAILLVFVFGIIFLYILGSNLPKEKDINNVSPVATTTSQVPSVPDKKKAAEILSTNVDHYEALFNAGKVALGTTQYKDAKEGTKAFDDPNSSASKFSEYQKSLNIQNDMTYIDAFKEADSNYTAENEPDAIGTWRDDMTTLTGDLYKWVTDAISWQISTISTAQLQADELKVTNGLSKARGDIQQISGK